MYRRSSRLSQVVTRAPSLFLARLAFLCCLVSRVLSFLSTSCSSARLVRAPVHAFARRVLLQSSVHLHSGFSSGCVGIRMWRHHPSNGQQGSMAPCSLPSQICSHAFVARFQLASSMLYLATFLWLVAASTDPQQTPLSPLSP
jgi:hypothetical protein